MKQGIEIKLDTDPNDTVMLKSCVFSTMCLLTSVLPVVKDNNEPPLEACEAFNVASGVPDKAA
jgi:hypothetical protein